MKTRLIAVLLGCLVASTATAQLHVPVAYDLGVGKRLEGLVTGGSICEPDGLSVTVAGATGPTMLPYEEIDKVSNMALDAKGALAMEIAMRDGKSFKATAAVTDAAPILILQDEAETASGTAPAATAAAGKTRTFTKNGFKGISLIEFEAALPADLDVDEIKKLQAEMLKALDDGDLDKAMEIHDSIGDRLEKAANGDETASDTATPKK